MKVGGPAESFSVEGGAMSRSQRLCTPTTRHRAGPCSATSIELDVMARNRSNGGVHVLTSIRARLPGKGFEISEQQSTDRIRAASTMWWICRHSGEGR
jgi:hypothetical protein